MSEWSVRQIAEIIVERLDGREFRGSGYQISADTVLTAKHVLDNHRTVLVRFEADLPEEWSAAASPSWVGSNCDVALLKLSKDRLGPIEVAEFARLGESRKKVAVEATGFPLWKIRRDKAGRAYRDSHFASGTVAPISNRRSRTLEINVLGPAESGDRAESPWEGMSGAALWAADRIIGIIAVHYAREGLDRLSGTRIDLALEAGVDGNGRSLSAVLGVDVAALPDAAAATDVEAAVPRAPLPSLRAYRVPAGWRPDGKPCPVSDSRVADLGAWLCLDRAPITSVVASRPGTLLAEALTAVEQGPVRRGGLPSDVRDRVWQGVRADDTDLKPPAQAANGLVIGWPAGQYPENPAHGRSPAQIRDRVRATSTETPLVFLVEAELAVDAIAAAARIARDLTEGPDGARVEVFSLARPGDLAGRRPLVGQPSYVGPPAHRLMSTVAAQMHVRSLPQPPFASDGEPLDDEADPITIAASVVRMLNDSAAWGTPTQEAHAIGLVRDYAPAYFSALVRRHAAERSGPARWSSLSACAAVDDHAAIWLNAAPLIGTPSDVPRELRDQALIEAVALGTLRTGARGAEPWVEAARLRSPGAWEVAQFLDSGRPPAEFLPTAQPTAVVAADRADKRFLLTGVTTAPEACEAWWTAVGRIPLTEQTVATLATVSAESRRIAGFTADRCEPDPDFAELIDQMRAALRPPLPVRMPTR